MWNFPNAASAFIPVLALSVACAGPPGSTSPSGVGPAAVARLQVGVTTQQDVRAWLGDPQEREVAVSGAAEWRYVRAPRRNPAAVVRRYAIDPVTRFWETRILFPPRFPSPPKRQPALQLETASSLDTATRPRRLELSFAPDGVLSALRYWRDAAESADPSSPR